MLAGLSLAFTTMATNSTVLAPDEKTHVAQVLEQDAQVMSNTQLAELTVGQPQQTQDEILRINTEARPLAQQIAMTIPILAGLTGLLIALRMRRQPDPKASTSPEAMGLG